MQRDPTQSKADGQGPDPPHEADGAASSAPRGKPGTAVRKADARAARLAAALKANIGRRKAAARALDDDS